MNLADIDIANPCRPLNWRWQLAGELVLARRRCRSLVMVVDKRLLQLRESMIGKRSPARACPLHQAAWEIYRSADRRRLRLETWLLTAASIADVARHADVSQDVVTVYHDTFFDVRSRMTATDSLMSVLRPHLQCLPDRKPFDASGMTWRRMAYFGGEALLKYLWRFTPEAGDLPPSESEVQKPTDLEAKVVRLFLRIQSLDVSQLSPAQWIDLRTRCEVYFQLRRQAEALTLSAADDSISDSISILYRPPSIRISRSA